MDANCGDENDVRTYEMIGNWFFWFDLKILMLSRLLLLLLIRNIPYSLGKKGYHTHTHAGCEGGGGAAFKWKKKVYVCYWKFEAPHNVSIWVNICTYALLLHISKGWSYEEISHNWLNKILIYIRCARISWD